VNVFFVETPLQLMNAIEAKHARALVGNHLVVLLSDIYPRGFFEPLLEDDSWDSIRYVESRVPARGALRRRLQSHASTRVRSYYETVELRGLRKRLDALAGPFGRAERLFIGNYYLEHMRHVANVLPHDRLVLLDDGTTTLDIAEQRRRHAEGKPAQPGKSWRARLVDRAIGWKLGHPAHATFFSMYDLNLSPADSLERHDYSFLRARAMRVERGSEVLFLGQTIYYEGIAEEEYLARLRCVATHYGVDRFVYVPHKGEHRDRVRHIREELGLAVRTFDVPIEYQLAMRGPLPGVLASFYSSALENCRLIFGADLTIEAVYLDPQLLTRGVEFVRRVYEYYGSKSTPQFRVLNLDCND